ncbi:MAG TPA: cysteine desulfurase family protein [Candidatus Paceibacterota bacterium]
MERIYLDYAATTPVDPRVFNAMRPYFSEKFGNPGSVHRSGQEAIAAMDKARERVANAIDAQFREVIFTASATEANNLAFRGTVRNFWWNFFKESGQKNSSLSRAPHIITTAIEHESVLETLRDMEKRGAAKVTILPVDHDGVVNLKKLKAALNKNTVLVSVMYASNEIGTIQPILEISKMISEFKNKHGGIYPLLHTDAAQAFQYLDCNVNTLSVDLMTLSSHKIYGPKGVGALYVRSRNNELGIMNNKSGIRNFKTIIHNSPFIAPIITGGGQEFGLHSGTENVPAIVGFGRAAELLTEYAKEPKRIGELRDYFLAQLKKIKPRVEINGPVIRYNKKKSASPYFRLPNNLNVYFPDSSSEKMLVKLDTLGIEASAGSACAVRSLMPSYVIKALGFSEKRAKSSLRFSLGRQTTLGDIDEILRRIKNI